MLELCVLLFGLLLLEECHGDDLIYMRSPKCNYLSSTNDQDNSYVRDGLQCCMCGVGKSWTGDCNHSHPNTTKCTACHFSLDDPYERYYIDFQPHLQETCFLQKPEHCFPPKVAFAGSTTERARCICPTGMQEATDSHDCISVSPTTGPLLTKLIESTSVKTTHASGTSPDEDLLANVVGTSTVRTLSYGTVRDMATPSNRNESDVKTVAPVSEQLVWPLTGIAVGLILFFALLALGFCVRSGQCGKVVKVEHPADKGDVAVCPENSQVASDKVSYVELSSEEIPASTSGGFSKDADSNTDSMEFHSKEVAPASNCTIPIDDASPRDPRPPGTNNNKEFAIRISEKMVTEIRRADLQMIFRMLINEPDKSKSDNEIEEILDKHESTRERTYRLMLLAYQKLGYRLTPEYIRERFSRLDDYQNLVDIVNDELATVQHR